MIDFKSYKPQRIFLVQGNEETYEGIVRDVDTVIVQKLSVSRFTVDHAHVVSAFATEGTGDERLLIIYFSIFLNKFSFSTTSSLNTGRLSS